MFKRTTTTALVTLTLPTMIASCGYSDGLDVAASENSESQSCLLLEGQTRHPLPVRIGRIGARIEGHEHRGTKASPLLELCADTADTNVQIDLRWKRNVGEDWQGNKSYTRSAVQGCHSVDLNNDSYWVNTSETDPLDSIIEVTVRSDADTFSIDTFQFEPPAGGHPHDAEPIEMWDEMLCDYDDPGSDERVRALTCYAEDSCDSRTECTTLAGGTCAPMCEALNAAECQERSGDCMFLTDSGEGASANIVICIDRPDPEIESEG